MLTKCDWCGAETEINESHFALDAENACHMCPACIIALLPKVPIPLKNGDESSEGQSSDRRRIERLPVQTRVYLSRPNRAVEVIQVMLLDISDAGMKIKLREKLNMDERVVIGFFSSDLVYKAIGNVRHIKEVSGREVNLYETGVRITGIHQELR